MDSFKDFIKYNAFLIHLDLRQTGLMQPAIKLFGYQLTRASSLRCIHLCGNEGVDAETIEWLKERIRGTMPRVQNNFTLYKKKT